MANRWGKNGNSDRLYFLALQNHSDDNCSHEINRRFLLERKAMTNLDSVSKSRDITLPTKICLGKAMVFPVVMYGCESWTIKKTEQQRIDVLEFWCWRRLLKVPWAARRWKQLILKEISPEYSLEGLMLKLQYFHYLMGRANSWKRFWWRRGRGGCGLQRMGYLDGTINSMDINLSKLWEIAEDIIAWHVALHGTANSRTCLSDWTKTTTKYVGIPNITLRFSIFYIYFFYLFFILSIHPFFPFTALIFVTTMLVLFLLEPVNIAGVSTQSSLLKTNTLVSVLWASTMCWYPWSIQRLHM